MRPNFMISLNQITGLTPGNASWKTGKNLEVPVKYFLNTDLIKPDHLLAILNSINKSNEFSIELSDSKLHFFYPNHRKPCLKNIPFCPVRRICMIIENENVRYMKLKELKTILETKNCC